MLTSSLNSLRQRSSVQIGVKTMGDILYDCFVGFDHLAAFHDIVVLNIV